MQQNHILTINQLFEIELACFMHRYDHGKLPVIVIYGCPLTNYTCGLKSKNALCSKKTRRTAKLNQSKKSINLKRTNELRQNFKTAWFNR